LALQFRKGGVYFGLEVKKRGGVISLPAFLDSVSEGVGVQELQACCKWDLPEDFSVAPTGEFRDLVDIRGEPVGAV